MQESIIESIIEIEIEIDKGSSTMLISNTISIVDKIDRVCSTLHEIEIEIGNSAVYTKII
jgi:hypothetical protein